MCLVLELLGEGGGGGEGEEPGVRIALCLPYYIPKLIVFYFSSYTHTHTLQSQQAGQHSSMYVRKKIEWRHSEDFKQFSSLIYDFYNYHKLLSVNFTNSQISNTTYHFCDSYFTSKCVS